MKEETTDEQKKIARNAHRLLYEWRLPPGSTTNGPYDSLALNNWLQAVENSCRESGHLGIAMDQVGKVLAFAPPDPDGLWIHKAIAEALDGKDADKMRAGFTCQRFNMRGVHSYTSGREEEEYAADYREKADAVERRGYIRLTTALRELASSYERAAQIEASRDPYDD